jgi:3-aminobutyryl-CoA ammonia-lyase
MSKQAVLRMRMSARDAHYGGNLVPGARMLEIFGDLITDLAIQQDGDEGLFRAYQSVDFLAPVYSGDFIEATGRMVELGNTSRRCEFEAYKVIAARTDISDSAADVLEEPILVCKAEGTTVVPADMKRT